MFRSLLALLCCAPFVALLWMGLGDSGFTLSPAVARFLPDYALNSLFVTLGAVALSLLIGGGAAWAVTRYEFVGRRVLEWALLLPLAVPAYLLAMVYGHWLDVAGPVQTAFRDWAGVSAGQYMFPSVRSAGGASLLLALALYPYVYLAARQGFGGISRAQYEAAWLAGARPHLWLWRVALPAARPALALGGGLVVMEALADFGVVSLFGVPTFTTGIYRAWLGLGEPGQAARLALLLLAVVVVLLWLERISRGRRPETSAMAGEPMPRVPAHGAVAMLCALPVLLGFVLPTMQLLGWALQTQAGWADPLHLRAAWQGLLVAVCAAMLAIVLALVFAYGLRARPSRIKAALLKAPSLGYAVPGSVMAAALFLPLVGLDRWVADFYELHMGTRPGLLLTGSIAAMVIACGLRFVAVASASVRAGLQRIPPRMDEAARLLGASEGRIKRELHLPALRLALLAGGFMVMVDTLKELPASLLLRPFDVSTLSIRTYELASDGRLVQASVPGLMLLGIGLLAVWLLVQSRILPSHGTNRYEST